MTNARHGLAPSPQQRHAQVVLVAASVLALGAALGPIWLVRIGVVVAVAGGVAACTLVIRAARRARREHDDQVRDLGRRHLESSREERRRNGEVVQALTERNDELALVNERLDRGRTEAREAVRTLQKRVGSLQSQTATLRGNVVALGKEVKARDAVIGSLRETVADRDAEIATLRDRADEADVVAMPRRGLAEAAQAWDRLPTAEDIWAEGEHPTVVDMQALAFPALQQEQVRKQA